MKRLRCGITLLFTLCIAANAFPGDERSLPVDFVFLVDRSLSMKPVMADVKRYLAGDVIGPLVLPGDSVTLLAFYGKVEKVWQGKINGEADKAALVRSLHKLVPNGRYTDIGRALDFLEPVIQELDAKERLKYILLLTDERQEAPPGSPYKTDDYSVTHPDLTYVNRRDLGSFRAITIGLGLNDRVSANADSLASFLRNPPERSDNPLPGNRQGSGSTPGPTPSSGGEGEPESEAGTPTLFIVLGAAAALGAIAVLWVAIALARSRKRDEKKKKRPEDDPA